jgi:hypothetical protein
VGDLRRWRNRPGKPWETCAVGAIVLCK